MGGVGACARCSLRSLVSFVLQSVVAIGFVVAALWVASLLLETLRITGITTVPPGIAFVDYHQRK